MKIGFRTGVGLVGVVVLVAAGLIYSADGSISMAGKAADGAREATFHSYRSTQSLKSLANGYELTINEYYSTVLDLPVYQKRAAAQKAAIDRELETLSALREADAAAVGELRAAFGEMEQFRLALERALSGPSRDWDAAREALFKLNVASARAAQQADLLAGGAEQRASSMDAAWRGHESEALMLLRVALGLALGAGALSLACAFLSRRRCGTA